MLIRDARPDEAGELTELALRSKAHWGYDAAFMASCREELTVRPSEVGERRTAPAERDGRVLGFTTVDGRPPDGAVGMMFVDPSALGQGRRPCPLRTRPRHGPGCRIPPPDDRSRPERGAVPPRDGRGTDRRDAVGLHPGPRASAAGCHAVRPVPPRVGASLWKGGSREGTQRVVRSDGGIRPRGHVDGGDRAVVRRTPGRGGSIMLILAVVSVPVWLAIGVQCLRARRAADERPTPPT